MPQWAGSSWYFLRYMDPHNDKALASKEALEYWGPVDWYNGGMEHTTLHLLYSRFWHNFLYDIGVVPYSEPYKKRTSHGMILGLNPHSFQNLPAAEQKKLVEEYGSEKAAKEALVEKYGEMANHPVVKMSKSLGNVVNPDDIVRDYGADTMRTYEMFMGDFEQSAPWNTSSIAGCKRFLDRIWKLQDCVIDGDSYRPELEVSFNQTIKKVSEDIETLKYNTAIAAMMGLLNKIEGIGSINRKEYRDLLIMLNPFAPHITEELFEIMGFGSPITSQHWVTYDPDKCTESTVEIAVQICGKVRAKLNVPVDISAEDAIAKAKAEEKIAAAIAGKTIVKELYVKGKLVNIVAK